MKPKRILLTGHVSTVGDIESLEIVQKWLDEIGLAYDTAPFKASIRKEMRDVRDLAQVNPKAYSHMVMICGGVWKDQLNGLEVDLSRFKHCARIGLNLTMVEPLQTWNPFDVLLERDSNRLTRPDLTLFADTGSAPVVGRCFVRRQSSYTGWKRHAQAQERFNDLIKKRNFAAIDFDSRWHLEKNGLRSPAHFLSALRRVDLLFTNTSRHGLYA